MSVTIVLNADAQGVLGMMAGYANAVAAELDLDIRLFP
jgi:hypothetical protein